MGSHQVRWDLHDQVKFHRQDHRSLATRGAAATNGLLVFRMFCRNNPAFLMARIDLHRVPVSAVEVGA